MFSITLLLILTTTIISIAAFNNEKIKNDLIFYPPSITGNHQYYRFISSGFIHGDYIHLIFNMLSFYFFGEMVENKFVEIFGKGGKMIFLLMYFSALIVSLLPTYWKNKNNYQYLSLGASGAVSAVIFAGVMFAPYMQIGLLIIPFFKIPGFIFGPLFLFISAYLDRKGGGNINHSAHIWGALYGIGFVIIAGMLAGYPAIEMFIRGVQYYFSR